MRAEVFVSDRFWRHLNRLADAEHAGHQRWLIGEAERDDRYKLWCQQCGTAVVEMQVDRTGARPV